MGVILRNKLLYKMGQDFLDIQYINIDISLDLISDTMMIYEYYIDIKDIDIIIFHI